MTVPESINRIIQILLYMLGAYIAALYAGLVVWTARDIASRSRDWLARILAVLLVAVFNIPGLLLYVVLRPRETLSAVYSRALEEEALLRDIEEQTACPSCRRRVAQDYMVCPYCRTSLKSRCPSCERLLSPGWELCPYCGRDQTKPTRPARARAAAATAQSAAAAAPSAAATAQSAPPDEATSPTS